MKNKNVKRGAHSSCVHARSPRKENTWQLLFARAEENCAGCNFQQRFLFKIIV
jgi:hypothetical protein